jgi:hypothetical protein
MIVAIMQPYFFPYIGYFQLMKAVDIFVFYDDVQYMKGGWVNRNQIEIDGAPSWITMPIRSASLAKTINEREYLLKDGVAPIKNKLRAAYAKSSEFTETFQFISSLLDFGNANVAAFNINLLIKAAHRFGINCEFLLSSDIEKPADLRNEEKLIDLCQRIGTTQYINAAGGMKLYNTEHFAAAGLQLSFLQTKAKPVHFNGGNRHLSIIDSAMRHGMRHCSSQLSEFELLSAESYPTSI